MRLKDNNYLHMKDGSITFYVHTLHLLCYRHIGRVVKAFDSKSHLVRGVGSNPACVVCFCFVFWFWVPTGLHVYSHRWGRTCSTLQNFCNNSYMLCSYSNVKPSLDARKYIFQQQQGHALTIVKKFCVVSSSVNCMYTKLGVPSTLCT